MPRLSQYIFLGREVVREDEWPPYTVSFASAGFGAWLSDHVTSNTAVAVGMIMVFALVGGYVTAFVLALLRRRTRER